MNTTTRESRSLKRLVSCRVGDLIRFAEERNPYRVRARNSRYLVCGKPFAPRKTTIYCIVDLHTGMRGPENLIFGMGAETLADCEDMLARLEGHHDAACGPTQLSHRRSIPVVVISVKAANNEAEGCRMSTKALYLCPGCDKIVERDGTAPRRKSFCIREGRDVVMVRVSKAKAKTIRLLRFFEAASKLPKSDVVSTPAKPKRKRP